jgi:hypothetical protein
MGGTLTVARAFVDDRRAMLEAAQEGLSGCGQQWVLFFLTQ